MKYRYLPRVLLLVIQTGEVKTRISDAREKFLPRPVIIVAVSGPHSLHDSIGPMPSGDILIHSGNLTNAGTEGESTEAFDWLQSVPGFEYKKWIGGTWSYTNVKS